MPVIQNVYYEYEAKGFAWLGFLIGCDLLSLSYLTATFVPVKLYTGRCERHCGVTDSTEERFPQGECNLQEL